MSGEGQRESRVEKVQDEGVRRSSKRASAWGKLRRAPTAGRTIRNQQGYRRPDEGDPQPLERRSSRAAAQESL